MIRFPLTVAGGPFAEAQNDGEIAILGKKRQGAMVKTNKANNIIFNCQIMIFLFDDLD